MRKKKKKKHQHKVRQLSYQNESESAQPAEGEYVTMSWRISKPPEKLQYVAFESVLEEYDYQDENKWFEKDLLAFKASSDPDTMYHY